MARLRTAVLISGRGSNLEALAAACAAPDHPAEIVLVVSNVPGAAGLERAEAAGLSTRVIDHRGFGDRRGFEAALDSALRGAGVELVCLAGFMRLLGEDFVQAWRDRLINIHPSLMPAFKGLDTHRRALQAGVRFTGCTVHFVRPAMDEGPIIVQGVVPVHADDTEDSLAARVLAVEHRIYPLAVRLIAEDRVRLHGETVTVEGSTWPEGEMVNPLPRD